MIGLDCLSDYYDVALKKRSHAMLMQSENFRAMIDKVETPGLLMGLFSEEKPDMARATEMVAEGTFMWNAGIFLFKAKDIIAAFTAHARSLNAPVTEAVDTAQVDLGFLRLDADAWGTGR